MPAGSLKRASSAPPVVPLSHSIWAGIAATLVLMLASISFFLLYKDPMILVFATLLVVAVWIVLLVVRRGIPVRVVGKE